MIKRKKKSFERVLKTSDLKACSRCGGLHKRGFVCAKNRVYNGGFERLLRKKAIWRKKSLEIRDRATWLCEVCKDQGWYTFGKLQVHHIESVKNNPEKLIEDFNLICLCSKCHKQADCGKISQDYLKRLVQKREGKLKWSI